MKIILSFAFVLVLSSATFAQSTQPHIELEADPIAFVLKGYSFHAGLQHKKLRYDLGVFSAEQPEFFHGNEGFTVKSSGFGAKVDYLGDDPRGWFVGLEGGYISTKASFDETNDKDTGHEISAGVRFGYRFMFGNEENQYRGFYIAPWVGFGYSFFTDKIKFKDREFDQTNFSIFPTVHIGYRF